MAQRRLRLPGKREEAPEPGPEPAAPPEPTLAERAEALRARGEVRARFDVARDYRFPSYTDFQSLYRSSDGWLIPRTEVWEDGELLIEVNALGCKGPDIDPSRPTIVFCGDSTTMGIGAAGPGQARGWPFEVSVPGQQVLNAAIEGSDMKRSAEQYERLRDRVAISCVVAYSAWHNLVYNVTDEAHWHEQLSRFLSGDHPTAFCNIATPLSDEVVARGIDGLLNETAEADLDGDYFTFWAALDPAEYLEPLVAAIARYNTWLASFCERTGAHLIDLHSHLRPESYETATRDFFDVCHPRVRAYPKIGAYVSEELQCVLVEARPARAPAPQPKPAAEEQEDLRKNIYPVW